MTHNRSYAIPPESFDQLDTIDKLYREHTYTATLLHEDMIRQQGTILAKLNPKEVEKWRKGFIRVEIDWKEKKLIITPTSDPEKKAQEVAEAIKEATTN